MRIVDLIENTEGKTGCKAEHGLSFYIETARHKILMDTGASGLLLENARQLGIDLSAVDTVVISHGHYDHGGGLPAFMAVNPTAAVYLQASAAGDHYSLDEAAPGAGSPDAAASFPRDEHSSPRYIGLPDEIRKAGDGGQIRWLKGDCRIDEELYIFAGIGSDYPVPAGNRRLKWRPEDGRRPSGSCFVQDDFRHEQCLVISDRSADSSVRLTLLSGCAHHGILNVLERFRQLFGRDPDRVISGFHMMRRDGCYSEEDLEQIRLSARILAGMDTVFYTGHCTGAQPYSIMKAIMGDRLHYVHCGDTIER